MYDVSLIIPTYNRCELLEKTLISIAGQQLGEIKFETIIADDGSTDETYSLVKKYKDKIDHLKYVWNEHEGYRVAYVRNNAIMHAKGNIIIFIDSGMLIDKRFVYEHFKSHQEENAVVIGSIYGYTADANENFERFSSFIHLEDLDSTFAEVISRSQYDDQRHESFKHFDFGNKKMLAPYALFWTGNVSVKKKMLDAVDGFDEKFIDWGMEDVELGYKLYRAGADFIINMDAKAIHIPHYIGNAPFSNPARDKNNRIYFHNKYKNIDTELFYVGSHSIDYNILLSILFENSSKRFDYTGIDVSSLLDQHRDNRLSDKGIIFGAYNGGIAQCFETPTLLEYDTAYYKALKKRYPEFPVYHQVGALTPFSDKEFSWCIITDYWFYLSERMVEGVLQEALRIADKIIVLYQISTDKKNVLEADAIRLDKIMHYLAELKCVVKKQSARQDDHSIYYLQCNI